MNSLDIKFLLDVVTSYVTFGLGLYAIGAIASLVWLRAKQMELSFPVSRDSTRAAASVVALIILDGGRQIWDSFHSDHFPIWITRLLLPPLYVVLGNAIFRLSNNPATGHLEADKPVAS